MDPCSGEQACDTMRQAGDERTAWTGTLTIAIGLALCCAAFLPLSSAIRGLVNFFLLRRRLQELVPEPEEHHWLIGHRMEAADGTQLTKDNYQRWSRKLPRMFLMHLGLIPIVSVQHPDTIEAVVRAAAPKPSYLYGFLKDFVGNGLVTSGGKRHERDRRLLTKAFSKEMLRGYVDVYKSAAAVMIDKWVKAASEDSVLEVEQDLLLFSCDVIMQLGMGLESDCQLESGENEPTVRYLENARWLSASLAKRIPNLLYHNNFIFFNFTSFGREYARRHTEVIAYCKGVIEAKRQDMEGDLQPRAAKTILESMLTVQDEDGRGLSDEEIVDHVNTFLDVGHDTTSITLEWLLWFLGKHQNIQEKCRDEIMSVVDEVGGAANLQQKDLAKLQYVTQVIRETMRLSCVVSVIARTLTESTRIGEAVLPADTVVQITMLGLHDNAEVWPEPEKFDPDRFSPETSAARSPLAFLPFGAGARSCIARYMVMDEMKVIAAAVLSTFNVRLANPGEEMPGYVVEVVGKPEPRVKIRLEAL